MIPMITKWNYYPLRLPVATWWEKCRAAVLLTEIALPLAMWRYKHAPYTRDDLERTIAGDCRLFEIHLEVASRMGWHIEITRRRFTVFAYTQYAVSLVNTRKFNLYLLHLRENVFTECGFRFKTTAPRKHDGRYVSATGLEEIGIERGVFSVSEEGERP